MILRKYHIIKAPFVVQLAMWMALAPIAPELHQIFASHRHVFSFEHHQIEDVAGPPQIHLNSFKQIPSTREYRVANSSKLLSSHNACLFSNIIIQLLVTPRNTYGESILQDGLKNTLLEIQHIKNTPILAEAPKHSPPSIVS
jgi:hypothetical protein